MNDGRPGTGARRPMTEQQLLRKRERDREYRKRKRDEGAKAKELGILFGALPTGVKQQILNHTTDGGGLSGPNGEPFYIPRQFSSETGKMFYLLDEDVYGANVRIAQKTKLERIIRNRRGGSLGGEYFTFALSTTNPTMKVLARKLVAAYKASNPSPTQVLTFLYKNIVNMERQTEQSSQKDPNIMDMIVTLLADLKPAANTYDADDVLKFASNIVRIALAFWHPPQSSRKVAHTVYMMARLYPSIALQIYADAAYTISRYIQWSKARINNRRAALKHRRELLMSNFGELMSSFARYLGLRGVANLRNHPEGIQFIGEAFIHIVNTNDPDLIKWYVRTTGININDSFSSIVTENVIDSWFKFASGKNKTKAMNALMNAGYTLRVMNTPTRARRPEPLYSNAQLSNTNDDDEVRYPNNDVKAILRAKGSKRRTLIDKLLERHPNMRRRL